MNDKNTYVIHFDSNDGYRYTDVVRIPKTGLPRKAEINRVVVWARTYIPGLQRVTNVTGPVNAYEANA
jgi:hypothetical protein